MHLYVASNVHPCRRHSWLQYTAIMVNFSLMCSGTMMAEGRLDGPLQVGMKTMPVSAATPPGVAGMGDRATTGCINSTSN